MKTCFSNVFTRNNKIRIRIKKFKYQIDAEASKDNIERANNTRIQLAGAINDNLISFEQVNKTIVKNTFEKGYLDPTILTGSQFREPNIHVIPNASKLVNKTPTLAELIRQKDIEFIARESVIPYQKHMLKAQTIDNYSTYLNRRFTEIIDVEVGKLTFNHIKQFIDKHSKLGNSVNYVKNLFLPLKEIIKDCEAQGIITENIFNNPYISIYMERNLRKSEKLPTVLTINEVLAIVNAPSSYIRSIVIYGLFTGSRIGETLALEFDKINFNQNTISIVKQKLYKIKKTNDLDGDVYSTPKSANGIRNVPIILTPTQNVVNQFERVLLETIVFEYNRRTSNTVFVDPSTGHGWKNSERVNNEMQKFLKELGINKKPTFHDLRYWFTAFAVDMIGINAASKILGHKTIEETIRDYSRIKPDDLLTREEAEKMLVFRKA